jgi:predicted LPLAT superfamily acyltransferase
MSTKKSMTIGNEAASHWSGFREAGTLLGMRFLLFLNKYCGRYFFSIAMYPVAAYFVLFRRCARQSSLAYLSRLHAFYPQCLSGKPNYWMVLQHFKTFAEAILDKLLAWFAEIGEDAFVLIDAGAVDQLMKDERGQLIIGSHFGNLEFCRGFMQRHREKTINILIYDKHAANFVRLMEDVNVDSRVNVFQVDEFDIAIILLLKDKIDKGEWIFIAGDRIPLAGLQRTVSANFLGQSAPFPIGPYVLAKALGCPVKLMFGYHHPALLRTQIYFEVISFADRVVFSRQDRDRQIAGYAQVFATALQERCVQSPYQWFNFYNFWSS